RDVLHQHARMNSHVIDTLLGLLLDYLKHYLNIQILHAPNARQRFVDGHSADWHRRFLDDGLADTRDVAAGREIHHGIGAVAYRVAQLIEFRFNVGCGRGAADIGVNFAYRFDANAHRLQVSVVDV